MLFAGAKVSQLALLPHGAPERRRRAAAMVEAMDAEGFGNCTNERECEGDCPKEISFANIARLNREYLAAKLTRLTAAASTGHGHLPLAGRRPRIRK